MNSNDDILQKFGERVRMFRLEKKLSQESLAELCELDRTYISSLERGHRNVGLRNVAAIASALEITLSDLFEGVTLG